MKKKQKHKIGGNDIMVESYDERMLIHQNKRRAKYGIGQNSTKESNKEETNEEYQAFLRKYEELTKE